MNRSNIQLTNFLQQELGIAVPSINMALRLHAQNAAPLPMILWQYGLVSLQQLEKFFDWLDDQAESQQR
ncbi:MAG: DUF2949 domain-containing protein [Chroococcidiopsidaceae cyanobacterium CP_BM_ER_R8_30]|nr:DUF2949 domain-containing protein [Chroococcidiopsidaceae cyanobacterium CP_BM_ER_R8_30]